MAKGVLEDIGPECARQSTGLLDLGRCRENNSERDMTVLARRYDLRLPVPLTAIDKTPGVRFQGEFKVISLRSWAQLLVDYNLWYTLVGLNKPDVERERAILAEFWRLYKLAHPGHEIWETMDRQSVDLTRCCPILLHGDEGRGRKKAPFLICAYHSFIGKGTILSNAVRKKRPYLRMRLNYSGSTWTHRFITAVLPKMVRDEVAFKDIVQYMTADCLSMTNEGVVSCHGEKFWMATLQVVGDWAFLAKAGNLSRSYSNCEKRPRGAKSVPKGICHWCLAGQDGIPFEDFRKAPTWKTTMFLPDDVPFSRPPRFLQLPHDPCWPAGFFTYDIWHAYHLGLGKTFLASVFAIASDCIPRGAINERFSELTAEFLQWCDDKKRAAWVTSITKESCGWPNRSAYPNGQWSKGHITTMFHEFLQAWFEKHENDYRVSQHRLLGLCVEANTPANGIFYELYSEDLWLTSETADSIGRRGLRFLGIYMRLATMCYKDGIALFAYMPKAHAVHHIFDQLLTSAQSQPMVENPMAFGVQMDEDFIGKCSRLSRRVGPSQAIVRVLERSLWAARRKWREAGYWKD